MKLEDMLVVAYLLVGSPSRTGLSTGAKQSLTMRWQGGLVSLSTSIEKHTTKTKPGPPYKRGGI
jgi:hypothetical protein